MASRLDLAVHRWTPATGALAAGAAMALMVPLSIFGKFMAIDRLVTAGNAGQTAAAIAGSPMLWVSGIAALSLVAVLDLVAAVGLHAVYREVNQAASRAAAALRIAYAALFLVALGCLVVALATVGDPDRALAATDLFASIWQRSLGVFGLSLLLVGYLGIRSPSTPTAIGILVAIAGVGYLADLVGLTLVAGFSPTFGLFGFIGEIALIAWLLTRGRRLP